MKVIQYLLIAVLIVAGVVAVVCAMEYLPIEQEILPTWVSDWLPELGTPPADRLLFSVVVVIIAAGLLVNVVQRAIDRRNTTI